MMATAAGCPLPKLFQAPPGAVFPLYHVLADVGAFARGEVLPVIPGDRARVPAPVETLALRQGECLRLLLANLTPVPQCVRVQGLSGEVCVRTLDGSNAERAMTTPEDFRADAGVRHAVSEDGLELDLGPYAVARVDQA